MYKARRFLVYILIMARYRWYINYVSWVGVQIAHLFFFISIKLWFQKIVSRIFCSIHGVACFNEAKFVARVRAEAERVSTTDWYFECLSSTPICKWKVLLLHNISLLNSRKMNKYFMVYLDSWPYIHKHDILFQNIRISFHVINLVIWNQSYKNWEIGCLVSCDLHDDA